jgi:anaphase-promoting complex subunit 4
MFNTITSKPLPWQVFPGVASWCPSTDLIVFAPVSGGITLYRLSGQQVWSVKGKKLVIPIQSVWHSDGKSLAVINEDGTYVVLATSNGRTVYSCETTNITCLKWMVSSGGDSQSSPRLSAIDILDVCEHLPRLPALPSGPLVGRLGLMDNKNVDKTGGINMMVTGTNTGDINVALYGIFAIGDVNVGQGRVIGVDCNQDLTTCIVVMKDDNYYSYVTCELKFISKFGANYLPEVSIIPAQISALMDYIGEAMSLLQVESASIINCSAAFVDAGLKTDLFDLLITGQMTPSITAWIGQNHERGYRKWNRAIMAAYESSRKIIFENLIMACERLLVLLSRLRGLARWRERGVPLGLNPQEIDDAIRHASSILEESNKCLWELGDEYEMLKAYSMWLENAFEELLDRAMGKREEAVKPLDVLKYIADYFPGSILAKYFSPEGSLISHKEKLDFAFALSISNTKTTMRSLTVVDKRIVLAPGGYQLSQRRTSQHWYALVHEREATEVYILRIDDHSGIDGARLACGSTIIQADFVDDESIMLLLQVGDHHRRLATTSYNETDLMYQTLQLALSSAVAQVQQDVPPTEVGFEKTRDFGAEFEPAQFALNGRLGRRVGCLLSTDGQKYIFCDLDEEDEMIE